MQSLAGRNIKQRVEGIKPSAIYAYTDKVVAWVADPLTKDEIDLLNQFGRVVVHERSEVRTANYFDKSYRQRLQIFQPSPLVLHLINERCPGATLSYVEPALDWVFSTHHERDNAYDLACLCLVKNNHRDQGIAWAGTTRYTGPRWAPNVLAIYPDKPSKITGEYCLHFDWRISKSATLRRIGIGSLTDLINLDLVQFWRKRLLLKGFDLERFGRLRSNHLTGANRRKPTHLDRRAGAWVLRTLGSVQAVIDKYRSGVDVRSCLINANVNHLLPTEGIHPLIIWGHLVSYSHNPLPCNEIPPAGACNEVPFDPDLCLQFLVSDHAPKMEQV